MKKHFITAVVLASMLLAACGAMPGDSAVTSAETEAAATEAVAETLEADEEDKGTESEEAKEEVKESEAETEEETDEAEEDAEADAEDETEEDAETDAEDETEEDAETDAEDETEEDAGTDAEDEAEEDVGTDAEDETDEEESDEEENADKPRVYSRTSGRSAAESRKAEDKETEGSEEEAEAEESEDEAEEEESEDETEDDEDHDNFWDMFPDASDGEYDNFWDMIADGDYDEYEDMFPEEEPEDDKDKASGRKGIRPYAGRSTDESAEETEDESDEKEEDEDEFAPSEGLAFKSNRDGSATITGIGTCTDSVLIIPARSPMGDIVTAIADGAFDHAEGIETVIFDNSTVEIGAKAFANSSIENLIVYDSVLVIDEDAFLYCDKLSYLYMSGSDMTTSPYAFDSAFDGADLMFVDSTLYIDDETFVYSGIRSILAEDCTVIIGEDAFDYCEDIETMEFVDCLTEIGPYAFFCTGYRMEVLFEDCDVIMGENAFAFSDIINLEINGSTVQIGEDAFDYCEALENIIVRSSVVNTDAYAFYGCGNGAKVVFENGEISLGKDAFAFADIITLKIIKCETEIGQEAFKSCVNLERVDICSGNIDIGRRAFYHCTGLKEVSLSDSGSGPHTIVIGDDAFEFCGLEKVMLGKGSIEIGRGAFEYCENLKDVKIRGDLESVGRNAFLRCSDELAIHYDGEVYDAGTIQDAVESDDENSPQPYQRSMPQAERRATPQPDQNQGRQNGRDSGRQSEQDSDRQPGQQPGRKSDTQSDDQQTESGSGMLTIPRIQAPRSYTPGIR